MRHSSSWARCIGLRVWNATTLFQPHLLHLARGSGTRCGRCPGSSLLEVRVVQDLDRARTTKSVADRVERGDAGVLLVGRAEDLLGHRLHLLARRPPRRSRRPWTASTGLPATFGSRSAIRLAPLMALASLTTFTIGTGQNSPFARVHPLGHVERVGEVHEARQRVEVAAAQHHGVRGRGRRDDDGGQLLGLPREGGALLRVHHEQRPQLLGTMRLDHDGLLSDARRSCAMASVRYSAWANFENGKVRNRDRIDPRWTR